MSYRTHSIVMPREDEGARLSQLLNLSFQPLRIRVGADDHGYDRQISPISGSRRNRFFNRRRQFTGRILVRPIAQYDIQDDESRLRVLRFLQQSSDSQSVIQHGMQPSHCECVPAQIDDCMTLASVRVI